MAKRGKPRHPLHTLRIVCQLVFFALFLALLVLTALGTAVTAHDNLAQVFLITDPLVALGSALAGGFDAILLLSLIVVAISALAPRAYCGWICPLGTTMDIVDKIFFRNRDRSKNVAPRLRQFKYALLLALVVMAAFGIGAYGWFDPICIATRSFGTALYPMADQGVKAVLAAAERGGLPAAAALYDWAEKSHVFIREANFKQGGTPTAYAWSWVFVALLVGLLAAQAYQKRFWCRNLCPLGGLLGLASSLSPLRPRVSDECTSCDACRRGCKTGAFQPLKGEKKYGGCAQECIACWACEREFCPVDAIHIGAGAPRPIAPAPQVMPSRRAFLGAAATGALLAPAFLLDQRTRAKEETNPQFRPPGALRPDSAFMGACIRCGECMRACPTNALHPSEIENGIAGLWTPTFIFNIGYCDYFCAVRKADIDAGRTDEPSNLCGIVCPTGAIAHLMHAEKAKWKIGTAVFDKSRCLPWARGEECLTCEEQCPLPEKAISHETEEVINLEWLKMPQPKRNRYEELEEKLLLRKATPREIDELTDMPPKKRKLALPYVLRDRCNGCGTCENVCPVDGPGGVRVERLQTREIK